MTAVISESAKTALRIELDRLCAQRDELNRDIAAINDLLKHGGTRREGREGAAGNSERSGEHADGDVGPLPAAGSFRRRVYDALCAIGGSGSASDVASAIKAAGFVPRGRTPLKILVSSELWRMAKTDLVRRTSVGRYERTST